MSRQLLAELTAIHGVALQPHVREPWISHPFSLTPTINLIAAATQEPRGWWAPCVWCAFGVAALAGGDVAINTRIGAESEPVAIPARDGEPQGAAWRARHGMAPERSCRRADPDWRKWTMDEAQSIFHGAGLTSDFWSVGQRTGRF